VCLARRRAATAAQASCVRSLVLTTAPCCDAPPATLASRDGLCVSRASLASWARRRR
jgi:hypothetical protein